MCPVHLSFPSHPHFPLRARNRHSDAAPLFRQVLELRQRVLGPEHPDTITSISNLAGCIRNMGRWAGSDTALGGWGNAAVCASQLGVRGACIISVVCVREI